MKTNRLTKLVCWMLMGAFACAGGDGEDVQPSDVPAWEGHDSDTPSTTAEELRQRRLVPGHTEIVVSDAIEDVMGDAGQEGDPVGIAKPEHPDVIRKTTWPTGFGVKSATNGVRCWNNGSDVCDRPKSRTFRMRFLASTCNATWNTRVFDQHTSWVQSMAARGITVQGPTSSGVADYYIQCGSISTPGTAGVFVASGWEGPDANGDYTWKSGTVTLDTADIDAFLAGLTLRSQSEKNHWAGNIIWHELLHVVGLGHSDAMSVSNLMKKPADSTWFTGFLVYNSTELNWLNTYVP